MLTALNRPRKLISLTGYEGFIKQLTLAEQLVLKYRSQDGQVVIGVITTEHDFERLVWHYLKGHEICGFYAEPIQAITEPSTRDSRETTGLTWAAFMERPIEQLVAFAIDQNVPAVFYA